METCWNNLCKVFFVLVQLKKKKLSHTLSPSFSFSPRFLNFLQNTMFSRSPARSSPPLLAFLIVFALSLCPSEAAAIALASEKAPPPLLPPPPALDAVVVAPSSSSSSSSSLPNPSLGAFFPPSGLVSEGVVVAGCEIDLLFKKRERKKESAKRRNSALKAKRRKKQNKTPTGSSSRLLLLRLARRHRPRRRPRLA